MTVKELKDFIYENYCRRIGFPKENRYYSMIHHKKKDLLLLATKLVEKYQMLLMLNNTINFI